MTSRTFRIAMIAASLLIDACGMSGNDACSDAARIATLPQQLDEASGIALSRRTPGIIWAHNDSEDAPVLYALDRSGRLLAEIALPAAGPQFDWEDIAAGPCPAGDCIYIGDIGDNRHQREDRAILRLLEPHLDSREPIAVERFPIRYPDGPEDAEAIFVAPDTTVFIITKGRRQPVTMYRYPAPLRAGERVLLERVQQLSDGIVQMPDLVTGADASPDGELVVVRTYTRVTLYRLDSDTLAAGSASGFDITRLNEPQGEGVAFAARDTLLLVTERGSGRVQPFLSRVRCTVP